MKEHKKFKCKDEVIYPTIDYGDGTITWNYGIVNYEDENYVHLVGGKVIRKKVYRVLPYKGNEHVVGTSDSPDEELKLEKGEYCFFSMFAEEIAELWDLRKFDRIYKNEFYSSDAGWMYAIRFSDFNPNNMEETSRHILCVKNGKVVRYKG